MGIRALVAVLLALAPASSALAQAVPPPRAFVGPPAPEPEVAPALAVPPPRSQPKVETPTEALSSHASKLGLSASATEAGAELTGDYLKFKQRMNAATALEGPAGGVVRAVRTTEKVAGVAKFAGTFVGAVATVVDTAIAYDKCTNPANSKAECVMAGVNVVADVAGFVPGAPTVASITWALSTAGGEYLNSLAPDASVKLYDRLYADEKVVKDATPAQLEDLRQRRHAAYERQAGALMSKQADYDAQQARIEAERQAATQQAAQQASPNHAFFGNLMATFQPLMPQSSIAFAPSQSRQSSNQCTPLGGGFDSCNCVGTREQCERFSRNLPPGSNYNPNRTSSTPAPSSGGGGCNLTAEDRAKGRVCTGN